MKKVDNFFLTMWVSEYGYFSAEKFLVLISVRLASFRNPHHSSILVKKNNFVTFAVALPSLKN